MAKSLLKATFILIAGGVFSGCAGLVSGVTDQLAEDLTTAILASEDPETIAAGLPAYLILVDSLVQDGKPSAGLLGGAAVLNGSYATAFVAEPSRQKKLVEKSLAYAFRAACTHSRSFCRIRELKIDALEQLLSTTTTKDVEVLYVLASSWGGYVQANSSNWAAVAELGQVKAIMARVVELDEGHSDGNGHLYLGIMNSFLPAAMGGNPEQGRFHFERAIELSNGNNLYAKVLFAESYARMTFDRNLHDRLVAEVLAANPRAGELTLQNYLAQNIALDLQQSADEYF